MQSHYAIFGGSFNPIHLGHMAVVEQLLQREIQKVIVIPTSRSPFKEQQHLLPNDLRLKMVQCTFQDWADVLISEFEIKTSQVTYTYHTLKHLHIQHPGVIWHLVLGWDAFQDFPQWKQARQILSLASVWVVQRLDLFSEKNPHAEGILPVVWQKWLEGLHWEPRQKIATYQGREIVQYVDFDPPHISSTDIRTGQAGMEWIPAPARTLYLNYLQQS